jgi:hypothetical protein
MTSVDCRSRQCGAILLLAMVFTTMLALLSASTLRVVVMELRMAGNESSRLSAFQFAEAVVSAIVHQEDFFPLDAEPGQVFCGSGDGDPPCPALLLSGPGDAAQDEYARVSYRLSRREPTLTSTFPLRESESRVSGSGHFSALLFDVSVEVEGEGSRGGSAHIVQGVAVRVPAPAR